MDFFFLSSSISSAFRWQSLVHWIACQSYSPAASSHSYAVGESNISYSKRISLLAPCLRFPLKIYINHLMLSRKNLDRNRNANTGENTHTNTYTHARAHTHTYIQIVLGWLFHVCPLLGFESMPWQRCMMIIKYAWKIGIHRAIFPLFR